MKNHKLKKFDKKREREEGFGNFTFEFLAVFGDGTTADELAGYLGRERETVQRKIIGPYRKRYPGALEHDRHKRRTRLRRGEDLRFCPSLPSDIVTLAQAERIKAEYGVIASLPEVPVEDLGVVSDLLRTDGCDDLEADPFRCLFAGLVRRRAVGLDYSAKTGLSSFSFSPHVIVRSSFRRHFRGFADWRDGKPGRYIDVIAERVDHAALLDNETYTGEEGDIDWNTKVCVIAELRDDLPPLVREALQKEFNLQQQKRQTTRPVRLALAEYVKQTLEARRVRGWDGPVWRAEVER